jgi:phospholipase/carboxylesterase
MATGRRRRDPLLRAYGDLAVNEAAAIARLLDTLDALGFIARYMHPPRLHELVATLGDRDAALRAAMAEAAWPDEVRDHIDAATQATLRACDGLRESAVSADGLRMSYRALRQVARAMEALYPLATLLPTVSRWFLATDEPATAERLSEAARHDGRGGVWHVANETSERGGFSIYVPEDYDEARVYPLVMALHGGSGHGRLFLWSWLREARGRDVILVAPTAVGDTWALMEPQVDSGNLGALLDAVGQRWRVDRSRLPLTGMSDGGTFSLLSGLDDESPFTHLAPVAASFHPLLLTMAEPSRVMGLPVYLVHGALDWMFPVSMARGARQALTAAGAQVTYSEIADLSHVYPREEGSAILDWFLGAGSGREGS